MKQPSALLHLGKLLAILNGGTKEDMVTGQAGAAAMLASYEETALCSVAFR